MAGFVDSGGLGDVGDDDGDFGVLEAAGADGFGDGEEVGAAAGQKDTEASWLDWSFEIQRRIPQGLKPR